MPEDEEPAGGLETPSGMATPSGMHSVTSTVPAGLETPAFAELRKNRRQDSEAPAPGPSVPRDLYQVIPERETTSKGFMGSSSAYDMSSVGGPGVLGAEDIGKKVSSIFALHSTQLTVQRKVGDVDVSMDDDEMSQEQLKAKYEASRSAASRVHVPGADADRSGFDDVVSDQMKKRTKVQEPKKGKGKEKEKFKF